MNPAAEGQSPITVPSPTSIGTPDASTQSLSAAPLGTEVTQVSASPTMQDSTSPLSSLPDLGETTMPPQFLQQQASETGAAFGMAAQAGTPTVEAPLVTPQEATASAFTQEANLVDTDKPVAPIAPEAIIVPSESVVGSDGPGVTASTDVSSQSVPVTAEVDQSSPPDSASEDTLVSSQTAVAGSPVVDDVSDKVDHWMNTNNIPTVIPEEKIAGQVGNYLDTQSAAFNPVARDFSKTYDERPDTVGVAYADLAAFITQEAQAKADALRDALASPQGQIVKAALDRYYGSKLPPAVATPASNTNS